MKDRMFRSLTTVLICVALFGMIDTAVAQNKRIGTSAASELLIPIGGRDLALGGSGLASTRGAEAMYWNPGGLGRMATSAEGMFSYMSYIADIGVSYGAAAARFGEFGIIGLSVKTLSIGDIPLTTADDPEGDAGRFFSPTYFVLGLSYGRSLTDNVSVGGTVKIVSETIASVGATGFAFDLGVQYQNLVGVPGLGLGVAIKNVGPQMKFDGSGLLHNAVTTDGRRPEQPFKSEAASFELPSLVEIGLSYTRMASNDMQWSVNSTFTNNNLYLDQMGFGGELGYFVEKVKLFGRAGYQWAWDPNASFFAKKAEDDIFGLTAGAGIVYAAEGLDITIDYAFRDVKYFTGNHVFSVKFGF
jgi:hypothetical protein